MSFSHHLFRGTQSQAREKIKTISLTQGLCVVNFLYFAQAMKFRVYEDSYASCGAQQSGVETSCLGGDSSTSLHCAQNDESINYKKALQNSDLLCIDGIAMQIFDRVGQFFFGGQRVWTENLNGTDFLPYILEQTTDQKIGIIMSTVYDPKINKGPEWMDRGLDKMKSLYPHIDIIFKHQTLFAHRGEDFPINDCLETIKKSKGKYDYILFLNGIGGPAQEIWTEQHKNDFTRHCEEARRSNLVILNNGATLDYYSGFETRAPRRVVKLRVGETLRRVITQPEKNLQKFLVMFKIIPYRGYIIKKYLKKLLNTHKTSGK